ncbi:6-carboxyhexanoate--CoA ligase [Persephonella sp.]
MLYSIKIRASKDGNHVSGSERIVKKEYLKKVLNELVDKTYIKDPELINIKIEEIKIKPLIVKKTLEIKEHQFKNVEESKRFAVDIIHTATRIKKDKIYELINTVHLGSSPDGSNMRGAMIVNELGERIELDKFRGVRTTTVDFIDRDRILKRLKDIGLTNRTADALCISTKNMLYKDMTAEYCISDEADYTVGYVSVKGEYHRLNPAKEYGNPKGGRIYFVRNNIDIYDFYKFLQETPVLIEDVVVD